MIKTILLKSRPEGIPTLSNFAIIETNLEPEIPNGYVLIETKYVSVDPYLRGRMIDAKSYIAPFEINKPIQSSIIAKVLKSKHANFKEGDFVTGLLDWKTKQIVNGDTLIKVDNSKAPLSTYLGILGMTGLTAYLGLLEIGKPVKGQTLVVSGAAGSVGSVVGQIGKIMGLTVIGIAGKDEKIKQLKTKFGFDAAINYKTSKNLVADIAKAAPKGVDIYFDNVGGSISDAILFNINKFSRIVVCGAISLYNSTEIPKSISVQPFLIKNSALMQGFVILDFVSKFPKATKQLATWLAEGKLTYTETVVEGFENIPKAFIGLFEGKNTGKMVVKI
ncbi:MAG TPA: NADP-dependent oxidoreductase [Flavobacteriia bacterium]|nr:NADP-dependent oxidoreductase [Flavobacteriia bacterium]